VNLQLCHDAGAMGLDRAFGGPEVSSDFLVQFSGDDVREDIALARRQRFKTLTKLTLMSNFLKRRRISCHRPRYGSQEIFFARRLGQEILGAGLHRVDGAGDVSVAGEEDDREGIATARKGGLEIEAARSRHPQVGHDAAAIRWQVPGEEVRGRWESLHGVPREGEQARQGPEHGRVVIHDIHGWAGGGHGDQ
jgi:hypothetical protein